MEYIFIFFFYFVGVAWSLRKTIKEVDERTPNDSLKEVRGIVLRENIVSLTYSVILAMVMIVIYYVLGDYTDLQWMSEQPDASWYVSYWRPLYFVVIATLAGFGGQALLDLLLGKSVAYMTKKINDKVSV